MIAISSFLLIVAVSLLITRVATVILVATGMSRPSARFQARSAFTGAGFTTTESEQVVNHPLRRRVVMQLMLLGNAGIVASAGSLILGFRGGSFGHQWEQVLELVAGIMAIFLLSRSNAVDRRLTALISQLLHQHTDLPRRDLGGLLQLCGQYSVKELLIRPGDWAAGRRLAELALREEGIVVLGITRPDGAYIGAPTGVTPVRDGDNLVLYGRDDDLDDLDSRPAGPSGDRRHADAVARQSELEPSSESSV